jgi:hypothetical protein
VHEVGRWVREVDIEGVELLEEECDEEGEGVGGT